MMAASQWWQIDRSAQRRRAQQAQPRTRRFDFEAAFAPRVHDCLQLLFVPDAHTPSGVTPRLPPLGYQSQGRETCLVSPAPK